MAYCLARSRFFILYHRILHYSSASDATAFIPEDLHKPFPKFLLTECGFTESEYKTLEKRFRTLKNTKCIETFRKSVHFFREFGFSEDQIKNMIIRSPTVIANNAEKTISPKLECLKKLGLSQQKIAQMTSLNPRFLTCSLEGRINPNIKVLEKVYTENTDLCRALDVAPWILCRDCKILQCLRILKESGIDGEDLRILMMRKPAVLTVAPEALTERIEFVKTLGISVPSKNYVRAVQTFGICKMETVAEKITLLQSLGFQADEIRDMLARYPMIVTVSSHKLKSSLDFLLRLVDYDDIVRFPQLFSYSVEECIRPRQRVIDYLKEVEPGVHRPSIMTLVKRSRSCFLKNYVYASVHCKTLLEIYNGTYKRNSNAQ